MAALPKIECTQCGRKYPDDVKRFPKCPACQAAHPRLKEIREAKKEAFAASIENFQKNNRTRNICIECGKEDLSRRAKSCPQCGAPIEKRIGLTGMVFGGLVAFIVLGGIFGSTSSHKTSPEAAAAAQKIKAEQSRKIKEFCDGADFAQIHNAYVDSATAGWGTVWVKPTWYTLNIHNKKTFAQTTSWCMAGQASVTIRDAGTDRKLAEYDPEWGYSNHED